MARLPYRLNVGAILRREDGRILLCERLRPRGVWQFPQGGVDAGESHEDALWRELGEELGFSTPRALCSIAGVGPATNYDFPSDYDAPIATRYRGQTQTLFLLDFHGADSDFALDAWDEPEFASVRWETLNDTRELLWTFKRPVFDATCEALRAELASGFER